MSKTWVSLTSHYKLVFLNLFYIVPPHKPEYLQWCTLSILIKAESTRIKALFFLLLPCLMEMTKMTLASPAGLPKEGDTSHWLRNTEMFHFVLYFQTHNAQFIYFCLLFLFP